MARWSHIQVLFQREAAKFEFAYAAHVPAPLCALMRDALAVDPAARPAAAGVRTALSALAADAAAW